MSELAKMLSQAAGAELRPYEPTLRDRLAASMLGDRPSFYRQKFVEGLTGSSGLGQKNASVADATPLGSVFALQESARSGDNKGLALAALGLVPGANVAGKVSELRALNQPHFVAYHGSPHSFDKFSLSKVGTGEGAQAYGHGLYFAENEDVARGYRETLSPFGGGATPRDTAARVLHSYNGDREAALAEMRRRINDAYARRVPYDEIQQMMFAQNAINTTPEVAGHMYQVRINADPQHFLDWDKPLSEQPANDLLRAADWHARSATTQGRDRWFRMSDQLGEVGAAEALRAAGVPGIKYLDEGSRGVGKGSRNYVVFDDKLVEIMRKYGIVPPAAYAGYDQTQSEGTHQ